MFEQVIKGLNEDLKGEYGAGIQYLQHASFLSGNVETILMNQSKTKFKHAKTLNDLIVYLGGIPTVSVFTRGTSINTSEMLKEDLQFEYVTMTRFLYRIKQLESIGLYDISNRIKEFVKEEQQHILNLKRILGIKKSDKKS